MDSQAPDLEKLYQFARDEIDKYESSLGDIAKKLWGKPELSAEEYFAEELLSSFLSADGFQVTRHFKVDTGFLATFEKSSEKGLTSHDQRGCHVAILCEYDALPEIGHACGHNLIAEAGLAAGLGVKAAMEHADQPMGKLSVVGCPDEESNGCKIDFLEAGVFDDVDVAMMVHPTTFNDDKPASFGNGMIRVIYKGRAAHACCAPWEGVNALDAACMAYNAISQRRQQFKPTWRTHGILTKSGVRPNIIPDETELEYYYRAQTLSDLTTLGNILHDCFEGAGKASGCENFFVDNVIRVRSTAVPHELKNFTLSFEPTRFIATLNCPRTEIFMRDRIMYPVMTNPSLAEAFRKHAESLGVIFRPPGVLSMGASTDMGNVSTRVPSIHPVYNIPTEGDNHTYEFATAAGSAAAQSPTLVQGKAIAMTAIQVMTTPSLLAAIREDFEKQRET